METVKEKEIRVRPGITPGDLVGAVRNTIPFIFADPERWLVLAPHVRPLFEPLNFDDPVSYFHLCLVAHHATVSSFVPTDVDNQIRKKLWTSNTDETLLRMYRLVVESHAWDYRPLSARFVESPVSGARLAGHHGEWLSTAVAAYGALRKRAPEQAAEIAARMDAEITQESAIFADFVKAGDGCNALRAATLIAHNLGDFERVVVDWNLAGDAILQFPVLTGAVLRTAGELNKLKMAVENHRHFPLRRPRALRKSAAFLLPLGPFLDDWGIRLCKGGVLTAEELAEIVEALVDGSQLLEGTVGYARALAGIESAFPGGASALHAHLPAKVSRTLKSGALRSLISQPRQRFESQWSHAAIQFCTKKMPQSEIAFGAIPKSVSRL